MDSEVIPPEPEAPDRDAVEHTSRPQLYPLYLLGLTYFIVGAWPLAALTLDAQAYIKFQAALESFGALTTIGGVVLSAAALLGGLGLFLRERWGRVLVRAHAAVNCITRPYALGAMALGVDVWTWAGVAKSAAYLALSVYALVYLSRRDTKDLFWTGADDAAAPADAQEH